MRRKSICGPTSTPPSVKLVCRSPIDAQLADTDLPRFDQAAAFIAPFLELLSDPRRLYESLADEDRQTLNSICFTRLHIATDADQRPQISQGASTASIAPLMAFRDRDRERRNGTCPEADAVLPMGQGSSKNPLVELRGFEPLTFSMPWKRATNCAKAP
jgi:site-specific DNA recombinase